MTSTISDHSFQERAVLVLGAGGKLCRMVMKLWPGETPVLGTSRTGHGEFIKLDLILAPERAVPVMAGKGAIVCFAGVTSAAAAALNDVFYRNTDLARGVFFGVFGRILLRDERHLVTNSCPCAPL